MCVISEGCFSLSFENISKMEKMEKLTFSQLNDARNLCGSDVMDGLLNYFKGN